MFVTLAFAAAGFGHIYSVFAIGALLGGGAAVGMLLEAFAAGGRRVQASVAKRTQARVLRALDLGVVVVGAAVVGYFWDVLWAKRTIRWEPQGLEGACVMVLVALIGAYAAAVFVSGSVRAGGHAGIVSGAVAVVGLVAIALSAFVPVVGYVVLVLVAIVAIRLRRRSGQKYSGLRILNS